MIRRLLAVAAVAALAAPAIALAQGTLNVYTSRHYDTDDRLYELFEQETGIDVNLIEGDADQLLERINREGDLSPADVFIAVDAARLNKAVEADVLEPIATETLTSKIPENLRHPDGQWYGFSKRVRVLIVSNELPEGEVTTYADLATDKVKGGVLVRSSSNVYNQSLMASIIANEGAATAQTWADNLVDNFARTPAGGDRDQVRGVAAGEGEVALSNHYYFARMLDGDAADKEAASKVRLVFPNQDGRGAHVNVSGAGVVKDAPNRDNAIKFLEFLTTDEAQTAWAVDNYEYPVVEGVEPKEVVKNFGEFKEDELNAQRLGDLNREAVQMMDKAGWR